MVAGKLVLQTKKNNKFMRRRKRSKLPFTKKQAKAIKKLASMSGEVKLVEATDVLDKSVEITDGTPFVWSDIMPLGIAEGTGEEQRIGDEIMLQSYHMNFRFIGGASSEVDLRLIAVYFPDSDGSGFEALYTNDILSFHPRKEQTDIRYKVLYDRLYNGVVMSGSVANDGKDLSTNHKLSLKVKGLKVQYDSSATTINRGNIKFIILTDTNGFSASDIEAVGVLRWRDV